jgi:glycosyltransferase involved in cell wall biosynthesis
MPPLVRKVRQLDRKFDFDCIWQTGNPFMPLTAVPVLKRVVDSKYVVDLRDSWTLHPYGELSTVFGRIYEHVSRFAEPAVVRSADAVTVATEGMENAYKAEYPESAEKFTTIENGYDPDDFPPMDLKPAEDFLIVYVGKFGNFRDPGPFFESLSTVVKDHEVRFVHVGNPEKKVGRLIDRFGLTGVYECTGYLKRSEVTGWIRRANLGLAITGDSKQEMTTKIFDYMACETPILGCGPQEGSMATAVEKFQYGYPVENDYRLLNNVLRTIIAIKPPNLGDGPYEEYTRRQKAEKLAQLLRNSSANKYPNRLL